MPEPMAYEPGHDKARIRLLALLKMTSSQVTSDKRTAGSPAPRAKASALAKLDMLKKERELSPVKGQHLNPNAQAWQRTSFR